MTHEINQGDTDICVGIIVSAQGIKGYVKVQCFTAKPDDIGTFSYVFDNFRKQITLKVISVRGGNAIVSLDGITSRNQAEKLQNTRLYIKRSEFPGIAVHEFYHADLLGCQVRSEEGLLMGEIQNVHNFGAGDILELRDNLSNRNIFYPFNKDFVIKANTAEKYIVVRQLFEVVSAA